MARRLLARYEKRRGDLSLFVNEMKQRVTIYMNKRHGRAGSLWEGRYKSVLVEGNESALLTIAAYIDLNPLRVWIVERPENCRWCGYPEAVLGTRNAKLVRASLGAILSEALQDNGLRADWYRTSNHYRLFLYGEGEAREASSVTGERSRRGFRNDAVEKSDRASGRDAGEGNPAPACARYARYARESGRAGERESGRAGERESGRAGKDG